MSARIKWVENVMFVAESETGHAIVLDGAPEGGGRNMGMRPMELMAIGVGSCSSYDVVTILKKARQVISSCEAEVTSKEWTQYLPFLSLSICILNSREKT